MKEFFADTVNELRPDFRIAKLVFCLGLEDRVLETDSHCADHALADIVSFEFFVAVLVDGLQESLAKSAQVCPAVARVLAINKGVESLAKAAVAVGETEFEGFLGVMQRSVNGFAAVGLEIFHYQIQQAVSGLENLPVIEQLQTRVEITVMAQTSLDMLRAKIGLLENIRIRHKPDQRAIRFGRLAFLFVLKLALFERGFDELAFPVAAHQEVLGKGVNGFGAYPVEADAELENIVVVLCTRVNLGHAIDHLSQRNTSPEIAHCDGFVFDADLDLFAGAHNEFVDGIVDDLF